jgi:hypothetical protein
MTKTFTACVGQTKKEFTLYTEIATRSSKFFQAALRRDWKGRDWKESRENRVTLAEVHPGVFEGYLQWLNTGTITSSFPIDKPSAFELVELYILGDFLDDAAFRNAVLDDLTSSAFEMWPGICSVSLVWENTPGDSPLRKLILEIWAKKPIGLIVEKLVNGVEEYPPAFVVALFAHMAMSGRMRWTEACCRRHFVKELREFRKGLGKE